MSCNNEMTRLLENLDKKKKRVTRIKLGKNVGATSSARKSELRKRDEKKK